MAEIFRCELSKMLTNILQKPGKSLVAKINPVVNHLRRGYTMNQQCKLLYLAQYECVYRKKRDGC